MSRPYKTMSAYQAAGDIWVQLFSCCVNQPAQQQKRQRRRIDRSMIGCGQFKIKCNQKGGYENPHSTVKAY
ncbi:hypothetical protein GE061_000864 [Apolygus lucorum]|uniref:Uncharacterized protein n=1 Tax=Apolygus lucorum TaxID=248454 RepID=A0A8S9Y7E8_APOLU|nr:hypothetical protein GE061_000864 [Apolygus lucorum]